jgi:hypothetical protein
MRREGLQARGIYKEVPRPSRGLALATAKRSLIVKDLIRSYINYITKLEFLPAFKVAFNALIIKNNIYVGF